MRASIMVGSINEVMNYIDRLPGTKQGSKTFPQKKVTGDSLGRLLRSPSTTRFNVIRR